AERTAAATPAAVRSGPTRIRRQQRRSGGGIAFVPDPIAEDDEDLSQYMHEDDVVDPVAPTARDTTKDERDE
ncbi:MAG: hypothetical protein AAGC55_17165, partial [Myxococcota bacterium]